VALSGAKFIGPWPRIREQPLRPMPEQALRVLTEREPGDGQPAVFNAYRFGGFLMYRLYPREVAFMDGRNDLYLDFRDRVYNPILTTDHGWRQLWEQSIRRYGIRWAMLDETDPLSLQLDRDPVWHSAGVLDGNAGTDGVVLWERNETYDWSPGESQ